MTIIEGAITRLQTMEKKATIEEKAKEKRAKGKQGIEKQAVEKRGKKEEVHVEESELSLESTPMVGPPPVADFVVDRVKRKRNRRRWVLPVATLMIAVFGVAFIWTSNILGIKHRVKNSDMYYFVAMMLKNPELKSSSRTAGREAEDASENTPESFALLIPAVEKSEIIVKKPESAKKEAVRPPAKLEEFSWIKKGWAALRGERRKAALELWEAGLRSLPVKYLVLVVGVYENQDYALKKLRQIGRGNSAFVVEGQDSGKNVYFLLSAPYSSDLQNVRQRIADAMNSGGIIGNYANKLLARMRSGGKIVKTSTGKKKRTVVAKTVSSKPKRLKSATVVKAVKQTKTKRRKTAALSYEGRIGFIKELLDDSLYSEAVDNLKPLFANPPGVWEPYLLMGTAYMGLGDLDVADSYFKKGLAIDEKRPRLWLQRAVVAQQKGDHDAALGILRKVEKLAPRMPEVKLNIAYSNDVLGKKDDAAKAYQSFLTLTEGRRNYFALRRQVFQRLIKLGYQPVG